MKPYTFLFYCALATILMLPPTLTAAQVEITIAKKIDRKIRITILPLYSPTSPNGTTVRQIDSIIKFDLRNCGYFELWPKQQLPQNAMDKADNYTSLDYDFWLDYGTEMIVKGMIEQQSDTLSVQLWCFDMASRELLMRKTVSTQPSNLRFAIHTLTAQLIECVSGGRPAITTTKIAYVAQSGASKNIYYMDYDGYNTYSVTNNSSLNLNPCWTNDATGIIYVSYFQDYPFVYLKDLKTNSLQYISRKPGLNAFPRISPDGTKIALTLSFNGNPEIYVLDISGTVINRVTYNESVDTSPTWSPDGRKLAFVSDRSGTPQIYVVNYQGGNPKRITYRGNYNTSPDWSPVTGSTIIVYASLYGKNSELCIVDASTGNSRRITTTLESEEDPSWAPDGIHVSYTLTQNFKSDIYFMDIRDAKPVRLTHNSLSCNSSSWSQSVTIKK